MTCTLRSERRPNGVLLLTGAPDGGTLGRTLQSRDRQWPGDRRGRARDRARYRIQPMGNGSAHVVVEVKTAAFPNESEPRRARAR